MKSLKTMMLMVMLTLMLVFVGGLLGGKTGMTFALVMAFGINFITYWFSDKIVLKMYRAKPVTETEAPELYSIVRRLAQRAGLPMPKVCIMEQDQPNAFATGRNPIATFVMMIVGPIAAMMVQMAISRSREYGADAGGAQISGSPLYLANALKKLHIASQRIPMNASPATAHMFIVSPLSGGGLLKLFSTHPPMEERIARLESMRPGA
jgi:Zn-dependent protease with chaperone function